MSVLASLLILAAAPADTPDQPPEDSNDPIRCERVEVIGSRLQTKRVCMRRSEWHEQRRANRMLIERTQVERGNNGKI